MINKEIKKIAIIGYGELGRAMHRVLRVKGGIDIQIWDKKDKENKLSGVINGADIIFICIPSWCLRDALKSIKSYIKKDVLIVSLAKGLEEGTLKTMDLVLKEVLGSKQPIAILSGSMLAEELMSAKSGFAVVASSNKNVFKILEEIFNKTHLLISHSSDLRGVALCGALKNIYALGLGICDGLSLGSNTKGMLTTQAIKEMSRLVFDLGGKKASVLSGAGVGDLISTAFSSFSRNREAGEELGRTGICCLESEGYKSVKSLIDLLGDRSLDFPFLNIIKGIILDNKKPADVFSDFLNKPFLL